MRSVVDCLFLAVHCINCTTSAMQHHTTPLCATVAIKARLQTLMCKQLSVSPRIGQAE